MVVCEHLPSQVEVNYFNCIPSVKNTPTLKALNLVLKASRTFYNIENFMVSDWEFALLTDIPSGGCKNTVFFISTPQALFASFRDQTAKPSRENFGVAPGHLTHPSSTLVRRKRWRWATRIEVRMRTSYKNKMYVWLWNYCGQLI